MNASTITNKDHLAALAAALRCGGWKGNPTQSQCSTTRGAGIRFSCRFTQQREMGETAVDSLLVAVRASGTKITYVVNGVEVIDEYPVIRAEVVKGTRSDD